MFEKLRKSSGRLLSALYAALLVNTAAAAVISASPAETLPADLSGYAMSKVTSSTPVEVKIENTVVSGVESVAADHPRGDIVRQVYDLSGKAVKGTPAPGVYIIREGERVTKTVIR